MTIGQVIEKLTKLKTSKEANTLLLELVKDNPFAWTNIKYVTGYLGQEERNRILTLFLMEN
jgi:hypothetical protein